MIFRFTAGDGTEHTVNYIADDKGYRVVGDSVTSNRPAPTPAPRAPASIAVVPVLAHLVQYVPISHSGQYIQLANSPATGNAQFVTLAGSGGAALKLLPASRASSFPSQNIVYSLIK